MIIFDAYESLFYVTKSEEFAFRNAIKENGIAFQDTHLSIYKEINKATWLEIEKGIIDQKELKIDRFKRFFRAINEEKDAHCFAESFLNNLAQASFLFDDIVELVENLSKTHRLILITNGLKRVQKIRIVKSVIAQYFEKIIISEEIGYAKPDPMIFIKGLEGLKIPPKKEIIIIGDSLTSDIQGGLNFGIDTLWYNPQRHANTKGFNPTYEIESLTEIHSIK